MNDKTPLASTVRLSTFSLRTQRRWQFNPPQSLLGVNSHEKGRYHPPHLILKAAQLLERSRAVLSQSAEQSRQMQSF